MDYTMMELEERIVRPVSAVEKPVKKPAKPSPGPSKAKQKAGAKTKLGALVRALHTLGVYDKVRPQLSVIEKAIGDAT